MTPAEVLRAAADYISKHGRIRGSLFRRRSGGTVGCAVGTCRMVSNFDFHLSNLALKAAGELLPENRYVSPGAGVFLRRVAWFNDRLDTTDQDVIDLFIQAAEKLEANS